MLGSFWGSGGGDRKGPLHEKNILLNKAQTPPQEKDLPAGELGQIDVAGFSAAKIGLSWYTYIFLLSSLFKELATTSYDSIIFEAI